MIQGPYQKDIPRIVVRHDFLVVFYVSVFPFNFFCFFGDLICFKGIFFWLPVFECRFAASPSGLPSMDRLRGGGYIRRISKIYDPTHMGVEPKIEGKNPKWMVKIMENPIKMYDLGGQHLQHHAVTPHSR